jgi:hypothetical protein
MKGTISRRSDGYIIRYETDKKWDEDKQKNVRKQKQETVPRKRRNGKWVPPNKGDAQALLAERLSQLNRGEFIEPEYYVWN